MKFINKISLCLLCVLCGCKHEENNRYQEETANFSGYLKSHFNRSIKSDSACYFLVSESGCSGCIYNVLAAFAAHKQSTFIMSLASYEKYSYQASQNEEILVDSSGKINRLPYHNGNIGLIETSNEKIDTIIYFEPNTLEDQLKHVMGK